MHLPEGLVKNAQRSTLNLIEKGVPSLKNVENSTRCLCESLKNFMNFLEFERFHDVTVSELKSRLQSLRTKNYLLSFKTYIKPDTVLPNNIIPLDETNLAQFISIAEAYKSMNREEKGKLHGFDTIENYLKRQKIVEVYKILKNNDKFIAYIEDGQEHLQTIEDYLVYQTLKEIHINKMAI